MRWFDRLLAGRRLRRFVDDELPNLLESTSEGEPLLTRPVCDNCGHFIHRTNPRHPWYHALNGAERCDGDRGAPQLVEWGASPAEVAVPRSYPNREVTT